MTDIRPTAKWANRMLRPLTSIYHRLEKHQENLSIIANAKPQSQTQAQKAREPSTHGSRSSAFRTSTSGVPAGGGSSDGEPDDPAWIPGKAEKHRIRHSYSSRGQHNRNRRRSRLSIRSPEVQRTLPGAIEIATPLITGKRTGRNLLEGSGQSARKRLFRDTSPGTGRESSEADEGRKTGRTMCFGAATASSTGSSCYAVYNRPWKEALDRSGDSGLVDIVRILDRLFLKFLHNTRMQPRQQPARGARSLLSMAVRRLPEFIAAEQEMQDEEDEDNDEDMCDAYFTELEAHYAPADNGWQPLREAVRAQGIYLVSEMLRNKRVTKLIACRLLEGCLNQQEYDALELLLPGFLGTLVDAYDYPASFDSVLSSSWCDDPVQLLSTYYVRNPGSRAFVFAELAKLLGRRVIPPEWMVTGQWKRFVDAAIQSLSTEEDDSAAAAHLIGAVVLSAGSVHPAMEMDMAIAAARVNSKSANRSVRGKDTRASHATELRRDHSPCPIPIQDALSNLTMSLITALCGMQLARTAALRVRGIVGYLAFTLQREIESRVPSDEAELPTFHALRRGSVLLGESLLRCGEESQQASETCRVVEDSRERSTSSNSTGTLQQFYQVLSSRSEVIKELAVLARQVFRCSERVHHHRSNHDDHQSRASLAVRNKVMQLAETSSSERRKHHQRHLSTFLGKVAAETAMQLAEATVDPDDHIWAGEVQEVVLFPQEESLSARSWGEDQVDGAGDHGHDHEQVGMYRWEESIEEWVARTPVRGRTRIDSKPAVGVGLDSPSSSASTASARSASPAPSDASSMTSSAPSEPPAKRKFSGKQTQEPEPEPEPWSKRLRSTVSGSPAVRTPAPAPTANTPSSTSSTQNEIGSSSSSHPRKRSGAMRRQIAEENKSKAVGSTIEVVITNRTEPEPGPGTVDMPEMSISGNKQDQRIPRMEESESEDELSLLC